MNEQLKEKLKGLGITEDQITKLETEGVNTEEDMQLLSADEIKNITECGVIFAKKTVEAFKPIPEVVVKPEANNVQPSLDILPSVPDDMAFLSMLKVGGDLKVGETEVIAAIRACLASRSGLFGLPKILVARMDEYAEEQGLPCGKDYYDLQKLVTMRNYGDIFAALDIDSASVTQAKKDKLIERLNSDLWPALFEYHEQIAGWVQVWQQSANNPAIAITAMATMFSSGGGGGLMPVGMMQPPETDSLRDGAEGVINNINKVFAGTGIVISRALALDANRIKDVLENPTLPSQVGATNREQMLKMLKVDVSADYVRLERNITRYALSIMEFIKVPAGQSELSYIMALFQLGTAIPWDKLSNHKEDRPGKGSNFQKNEE